MPTSFGVPGFVASTASTSDEELAVALEAVKNNEWPLKDPMKNGPTGKKLLALAGASLYRRTEEQQLAKDANELHIPEPFVMRVGDDLLLPKRAEWEFFAKAFDSINKKASEIFKNRNEPFKRAKQKLEEAKLQLIEGVWMRHQAHLKEFSEALTTAADGKIGDCEGALETFALPTAEAVGATVFTGVDARCETEYKELTTECAGRLIS